jgi:hypothetical protein
MRIENDAVFLAVMFVAAAVGGFVGIWLGLGVCG